MVSQQAFVGKTPTTETRLGIKRKAGMQKIMPNSPTQIAGVKGSTHTGVVVPITTKKIAAKITRAIVGDLVWIMPMGIYQKSVKKISFAKISAIKHEKVLKVRPRLAVQRGDVRLQQRIDHSVIAVVGHSTINYAVKAVPTRAFLGTVQATYGRSVP